MVNTSTYDLSQPSDSSRGDLELAQGPTAAVDCFETLKAYDGPTWTKKHEQHASTWEKLKSPT